MQFQKLFLYLHRNKPRLNPRTRMKRIIKISNIHNLKRLNHAVGFRVPGSAACFFFLGFYFIIK